MQPRKPNVWVVDRQKRWRDRIAKALKRNGMTVTTFEGYDLPARAKYGGGVKPDLVLLSCVKPDLGEYRLIATTQWPFSVVTASCSMEEMRQLFRHGAKNVEVRPNSLARILTLVRTSLDRVQAASGLRKPQVRREKALSAL